MSLNLDKPNNFLIAGFKLNILTGSSHRCFPRLHTASHQEAYDICLMTGYVNLDCLDKAYLLALSLQPRSTLWYTLNYVNILFLNNVPILVFKQKDDFLILSFLPRLLVFILT